ncbi:MAG: hypothetical protein HUJ91_07310, partial [Bacteroidales bacterium]|nr:hypothetical protein [Bacteroidales bacterium]
DIFVSEWDNASGTWSAPENLGFPFSSPADDLLFCNTPDGNYSLFASNRKCAADSMTVYLLKFDNTPIKKAVSSPEEARRVAALRPRANLLDKAIEDTHLEANMEDGTFKKYYSSVSRYSTVKDSIKTLKNELSESRKLYSSSSESDRPVIARSIKNTEERLLSLQTRLGDIASEMQVLEMDFLVKGTSINPEELEEEIVNSSRKETSEVKVAAGYSFEKRVMGKMPVLEFAQPEISVDLNFRIDSEGTEIISDFKLPEYLVYQIQLTSTGTPAPASKFKGINPVFETKASASKYIYRAGLFSTYAEANKKVATCKSKGFSGAFIVAYDNGGAINVKTARQLEEKRKTSVKYKVVFTNCPDGIPADVRKVISDQCSKDIARGSRDGRTIYFIAPFDSESDADRLAQAARAAGAEGVIVEQIK